jgi:hypothetical protein
MNAHEHHAHRQCSRQQGQPAETQAGKSQLVNKNTIQERASSKHRTHLNTRTDAVVKKRTPLSPNYSLISNHNEQRCMHGCTNHLTWVAAQQDVDLTSEPFGSGSCG